MPLPDDERRLSKGERRRARSGEGHRMSRQAGRRAVRPGVGGGKPSWDGSCGRAGNVVCLHTSNSRRITAFSFSFHKDFTHVPPACRAGRTHRLRRRAALVSVRGAGNRLASRIRDARHRFAGRACSGRPQAGRRLHLRHRQCQVGALPGKLRLLRPVRALCDQRPGLSLARHGRALASRRGTGGGGRGPFRHRHQRHGSERA